MNDKISPEVNHQTDEHEDFDPLAELARIVAGESENTDADQLSTEFANQEETLIATDDMEAELMRELQQTKLTEEELDASDEISTQSEGLSTQVESINELDASLDRADDNLSTARLSNNDMSGFIVPAAPLEPRVMRPAEPQAVEPVIEPQVAAPVETQAVEPVIEPQVAEPVEPQAVEPVIEPQAAEPIEPEVAELISEPQVAVGASVEAFEAQTGDFQNDLIDALQLELDDAPSEEQILADEDSQTEVENLESSIAEVEAEVEEVIEEMSFEEEMASIIDGTDEDSQSPVETGGIDNDEDLGKAFMNEFESRVGYTSTVDAEEPELASEEEPEPESELEETGTVADLELDFEQAFSNELGLNATDEVEVQSEDLPIITSLDGNMEHQFEDETDHDPGHSGEIQDAATYQPEEKSGGVKYAVVAIVIALLAGAGVAIYGFVGDGKSLMLAKTPVVEAIKTAYKTKPEDPGGKVVDNQDNATYAEVEGVGNQNSDQTDLVSNTEEPANIDQTGLDSSKATDRLTNTEQGEGAGATINSVIKPRVVEIQTVKRDGTIVASNPSFSGTKKIEEQLKLASNQAKEIATEVKTVATQIVEPLKTLDGTKPTEKVTEEAKVEVTKPVIVPVPKKRPATTVNTQVANVTQPATQPETQPLVLPTVDPVVTQPAPASPVSSWVVQVSSSPTQQEAQSSYTRMARKYPVIQGRSTNIVSAQVNGRTYYRLRLNTASKSDAASLCSQLKASGGDCFITR